MVEPSDPQGEVALCGEVGGVVAHELGDDFEGEQVEHRHGVQVPEAVPGEVVGPSGSAGGAAEPAGVGGAPFQAALSGAEQGRIGLAGDGLPVVDECLQILGEEAREGDGAGRAVFGPVDVALTAVFLDELLVDADLQPADVDLRRLQGEQLAVA